MEDYGIFISYRRNGGEALACLISERLKSLGYSVFYDVESLRSGKFNEKILDVIENCNDFILILPENALDRCVNEDDWIRKEISCALKHSKNIIPILMRNFEMPMKEELPEDISEIVNFNGISADMEYFDATFEKLLEMLSGNSAVSIDIGEYSLLYYSFSTWTEKRIIESKLVFEKSAKVSLSVNNEEYIYHGNVKSLDEFILLNLKNDNSDEVLTIYFKKPAGKLNRYLGLLVGLSSTMTPVCFKCVCIKPELKDKINTKILEKVLSHDNTEWSNDLLTLEMLDLNLFYSDAFFGSNQ